MIEICDDPFQTLENLSSVITNFQDSVEKNRKDKSVLVSIDPSVFYKENLSLYDQAVNYYSNLMAEHSPDDCNMPLTQLLIKKRNVYVGNLSGLLQKIKFV